MNGDSRINHVVDERGTNSFVGQQREFRVREDHPNLHEFHAKQGESSRFKVTINYINTVVGAGIVGLPYAMKEAGFVFGIFLMILMVFLSHYSVTLMVRTGVEEKVRNYEELMEKLFGFRGYMTVMVLIFLFDFGACVTFLIILGDVSVDVLRAVAKNMFELTHDQKAWIDDEWNLRRITIATLCLTIILPLCLFRDISKLERFSIVSVAATASVVFVCFCAALMQDNCPDGPDSCPKNENWFTVLGENPSAAFGIIAFTFISNDSSFILYSTLKNPTAERWSLVTRDSLMAAVGFCFLTAIPGYISFRDNIKEDLLKNYSQDDSKIIFVRMLFVLSMALTYPICLFISRHILNEMLHRFQNRGVDRIIGTPSGPAVQLISTTRHLFLTFLLFFSSVTVVMFVDRAGVAMSITGNVCALSLAFILPPACAIRSTRNKTKKNGRVGSLDRTQEEVILDPNRDDELSDPLLIRENTDIPQNATYSIVGPYALLVFGIATLLFCTAQTVVGI